MKYTREINVKSCEDDIIIDSRPRGSCIYIVYLYVITRPVYGQNVWIFSSENTRYLEKVRRLLNGTPDLHLTCENSYAFIYIILYLIRFPDLLTSSHTLSTFSKHSSINQSPCIINFTGSPYNFIILLIFYIK